ncbi:MULTISPECIES: zf-HC2 domain-containing protein [unclassified Streptomyces]|uniref:zf-HC2 domain-containing protein n=1 Tax=Streptomyces TaxID=1883 RepID=UPI000DD6AB51
MTRQRGPVPGRVWVTCGETIRHLRLRGQVEAYADGELAGGRRVRMAAHIDRCWACSGTLQLLQLIKASLRNSSRRTPPSLASARMRRLAKELSTPSGQGRHRC